jgi:twitching motility protein PilT
MLGDFVLILITGPTGSGKSTTLEIALRAAETGHLVFATLHTNTAVSTITRIIDAFPPHFVLQGVISQRLVPKIGGGRVLWHMNCLFPTPGLITLEDAFRFSPDIKELERMLGIPARV